MCIRDSPNTDYMEIMNSVRSKTFTFFEEIADIFTFIQVIIKETFSRDFEFKEFFYQCFQIGYKTLPLIAITGTITVSYTHLDVYKRQVLSSNNNRCSYIS